MALRAYSEKYLAEFVYGAIDGTVTTFAIVSGVIGAGLSPAIILVLGLANVFADGFSMASSNFLSEKSDQSLSRGVTALSEKQKSPFKTASVTFFSFVIVGLVPLSPFILGLLSSITVGFQFGLSIVFTGLAFVAIGAVRGIVARHGLMMGALETLLVGGVAAIISFAVGYTLRGLL